jgi:GDP-4-dehydro-6-deoxy-D-mannose reductase
VGRADGARTRAQNSYDAPVRVLITGIAGFVGRHLTEYLLVNEPEVEVFGLLREFEMAAAHASLPSDRLLAGDLLDAPSLSRALAASRPDVVIHLAAFSSVASSWEAPAEMMRVNVLGTQNLLEAVRSLRPEARVVLASSADVYGVVAESELPIKESQPFRPVSPYGVSKAAVDLLGHQYFHAHGLATVRLRTFSACGPGQSEHFVVSSLARQVAALAAGVQEPRIAAGNLDVARDFVDVRDVARAYWAAATRARAGEAYNVACGEARTIRSVLERLLAAAGASAEVVVERARLRPAEMPRLAGDASRLRDDTGWCPTIAFEDTLRDTLAAWRDALRR